METPGTRWLDNDESLTFAQNKRTGDTLLHVTGYSYGTKLVARVAEIDGYRKAGW